MNLTCNLDDFYLNHCIRLTYPKLFPLNFDRNLNIVNIVIVSDEIDINIVFNLNYKDQ